MIAAFLALTFQLGMASEADLSRSLQAFTSYQTNDCHACLQSSLTAQYCYNSQLNTEWCCTSSDTSSQCTTNASNGVQCSPTLTVGQDLAYTYCKGASVPTMCGVSTLELTAYSSWRTVAVSTLPASVIVSNLKSYPACYYHIKGEQYKWMDGAKIDFFVNSATDVIIKLYGGSSRTNASFTAVTGNASVTAGQLASIDYSTGLIVMVRARDNRFSPVSYNFSYGISGSFYPWYE